MSNPLHNTKTLAHDLGRVHRDLVKELRANCIATPELDARLLICDACAISHERFAASPEREVSEEEFKNIRKSARRRCDREPVSRILGVREFWGLDFVIGPETLDPRPDTETLVSAALEVARDGDSSKELRVLDLGTGSGCILVSLLHELKNATGVGTDLSLPALEIARANAERHGVARRTQFVCASWHKGIGQKFNLVTANPPYIPACDIAGLDPEVTRYDPRAALDGGSDGLDATRIIVTALPDILAPGGWAMFEIGDGQAQAVNVLLRDIAGDVFIDQVRQWKDMAGRVRCVAAKRSPML